MKFQAEIGWSILSLLVILGAAELTTGTVADATPQTTNFIDTTTEPLLKLPPQEWHPQIIVRVHNYAHVDPGLLLPAEAVATSILREAKVEASWVYCPLTQEEEERYPRCPANWGTNAFVLNILTPEMVARIQRALKTWDPHRPPATKMLLPARSTCFTSGSSNVLSSLAFSLDGFSDMCLHTKSGTCWARIIR